MKLEDARKLILGTAVKAFVGTGASLKGHVSRVSKEVGSLPNGIEYVLIHIRNDRGEYRFRSMVVDLDTEGPAVEPARSTMVEIRMTTALKVVELAQNYITTLSRLEPSSLDQQLQNDHRIFQAQLLIKEVRPLIKGSDL